MLKRHKKFIGSIFLISDLLVLSVCWLAAYFIRFKSGILPLYGDIPLFRDHLVILGIIVSSYIMSSLFVELYRHRRINSVVDDIIVLVRAILLSIAFTIVLMYFFLKGLHYSRLTFILFFLVSIFILLAERVCVRKVFSVLRSKGYNLRNVLVVGTGKTASQCISSLRSHPEFGYNMVGSLSRYKKEVGNRIKSVPVIGTYKELYKCMIAESVDVLVFALPAGEERLLRPLLSEIEDEAVDLKIVVDVGEYFTLRQGIDVLDGMPVLSLRDSPLYGWSRVIKRVFDILVSLFVIILGSPVYIALAILVKKSSEGPIFYKQERMGLDGKPFNIYKFRSMRIDAEEETGAVWSVEDDPRRTKIGTFMRETSLDEIPQFFNVLVGNMSLVGPRPERPVFVKEFKSHIPKYMLRHKMKAGITGWAQIKGYRGDTSLEKRIECDLFYIEHWSLWLDIKILFMTLPAVLKGEGAH